MRRLPNLFRDFLLCRLSFNCIGNEGNHWNFNWFVFFLLLFFKNKRRSDDRRWTRFRPGCVDQQRRNEFRSEWRIRLRIRARNSVEAQAAPPPDNFHSSSDGRTGTRLRTHPVPGRLHPRGTGSAHQIDGSSHSGEWIICIILATNFLKKKRNFFEKISGLVQQPPGSSPQTNVVVEYWNIFLRQRQFHGHVVDAHQLDEQLAGPWNGSVLPAQPQQRPPPPTPRRCCVGIDSLGPSDQQRSSDWNQRRDQQLVLDSFAVRHSVVADCSSRWPALSRLTVRRAFQRSWNTNGQQHDAQHRLLVHTAGRLGRPAPTTPAAAPAAPATTTTATTSTTAAHVAHVFQRFIADHGPDHQRFHDVRSQRGLQRPIASDSRGHDSRSLHLHVRLVLSVQLPLLWSKTKLSARCCVSLLAAEGQKRADRFCARLASKNCLLSGFQISHSLLIFNFLEKSTKQYKEVHLVSRRCFNCLPLLCAAWPTFYVPLLSTVRSCCLLFHLVHIDIFWPLRFAWWTFIQTRQFMSLDVATPIQLHQTHPPISFQKRKFLCLFNVTHLLLPAFCDIHELTASFMIGFRQVPSVYRPPSSPLFLISPKMIFSLSLVVLEGHLFK